MRDIVVTLMILGTLPLILKRPYIGILVWSWISYMNPHRLAWGFAFSLPFAQIVAITFIISLVLNGQKIKFPANTTVYAFVTLLVWMLLTSLTGFYPELALEYYVQVLKIQFFTLLSIALISNVKELNQLITVIVLSIGFYSIKGGVFTILTGGAFRVWGPSGTFIEENNGLAIATLMIIPLMIYLRHLSEKTIVRNLWLFGIVTSAASAVGSQSRGALIAILAVAFFYWLKTKGKFLSGIVITICLVGGYQFMPESWHERMGTTVNYEEDASATSRLDSWQYNFNLASGRFMGGGFKKESKETYALYFGNIQTPYVAHSIYFSVLGDHGWIGFALFMFILWSTWRRLTRIASRLKKRQDLSQLLFLAKMLQVSLIAFMSGGAFLNLSYWDLPWHLVALALILEREVDLELEKNIEDDSSPTDPKITKDTPSERSGFKSGRAPRRRLPMEVSSGHSI